MRKVLLSLVVLAGAASTACATASAKASPDRPTLEVPAPPTKVIEQTALPEPPPDPVPELPAAQPANTRTSKPSASREPARDTKPEAPTTTTEPPPAPVTPLTAPPQLRPSGTPDPSEAAKQVQITIDRARQALKAVNTQGFPKARQDIYRNAVLTLTQAEEALKKSDFENAKKLAQKVEDTAKELQR